MLETTDLFTVTDLKQFDYCGRVVFFEQCLPHIRPRTYKMDAGRDEHESEQKRAVRRTLGKYNLVDGERTFDVILTDASIQLTGIVDEMIATPNGEVFPVDYKLANKVSANHKLQLAAYAYLIEGATGQPVTRGFIYLIKKRQMVEVPMTKRLFDKFTTQLHTMRQMVANESMPTPTTLRSRCMACEFRRFCNDIL